MNQFYRTRPTRLEMEVARSKSLIAPEFEYNYLLINSDISIKFVHKRLRGVILLTCNEI